jgi:hypothetical protein
MNIFGSRIMAALTTAFNVLALNTVLIIAALPVVTLPIAVNAATVALDRWRGEGEDRVVREFILALRSRPPLRTTALVGVPLAAIVIGVLEIRHFAGHTDPVSRIGLGLGLVALLITLTAVGYVFLLAADAGQADITQAGSTQADAGLPAAELWSLSARLAIRNLFATGPFFILEFAAAAALSVLDPALLFLGVPVVLLALLRRTAKFGLRRTRQPAAVSSRSIPGPR